MDAGESEGADGAGRYSRHLEVCISDSGIGLDGKDLIRIFKPFEQAESSKSRRFQGTGLGLSLTKSLVDLHRGRIWAESDGPGTGSKFTFTIPIVDSPACATPSA